MLGRIMDRKIIGDINFLGEYDKDQLRLVALMSPDALVKYADQLKSKGAFQTVKIKVIGFEGEHPVIVLPPGQHLELED
jgi:hypothetical protein